MDTDKRYILDRMLLDGSSDCWLWQLDITPAGYGNTTSAISRRHHTSKVHRLSYLVFVGPIPDGLLVRHKCRNRHCCNPEHLELGTVLDNNRDKYRDGTMLMGSTATNVKLNEDQVVKIRELASAGTPRKQLVSMFQVSATTIDQVINRLVWKHI